jgi:hypothetical protein
MLLTLLAPAVALVWLTTVAVVVGLCVSAKEADIQTFPRRRTWRTVRSSSLTSAHSDQLATYR